MIHRILVGVEVEIAPHVNAEAIKRTAEDAGVNLTRGFLAGLSDGTCAGAVSLAEEYLAEVQARTEDLRQLQGAAYVAAYMAGFEAGQTLLRAENAASRR